MTFRILKFSLYKYTVEIKINRSNKYHDNLLSRAYTYAGHRQYDGIKRLLISFGAACHKWVTTLNTTSGFTLSPMHFICFWTWHRHTQHWSIMASQSRSTKCLTQHMDNLCTCWHWTWFETCNNGKQRWYTMTKYTCHQIKRKYQKMKDTKQHIVNISSIFWFFELKPSSTSQPQVPM